MQNMILRNPIKKIWKSQPTIEGAGVHLKRAFGFQELSLMDPFLLLDAFRSENPEDYRQGFPWHPHRGIETITYMLEGDVEHGDSMGNRGNISAGDIQWMTAGSGIIHQEMPIGNAKGQMWGFQLWANLPASHKMMNPRYQEVKQKEIPIATTLEGALVRVISGKVGEVEGPVKGIVTEPEYLDITIPAGKIFTHSVKLDHLVFAYVIDGDGYFDSDPLEQQPQESSRKYLAGPDTVILYGFGNQISIQASPHQSVRFLLASGKPIKEPIAWHGPIVMNTEEELRIAFLEYQNGDFIKRLD